MRCDGVPFVMMALVWGGTLNSSAANLSTAVKGAASGTLNLREFRADGRWGAPDQDQDQQPRRSRLREGSDPWEREPITHTLKGSLGSEVRMILKDTFPPPPAAPPPAAAMGCREEKPRGSRERTRRWLLLCSVGLRSESRALPSFCQTRDKRRRGCVFFFKKKKEGCVFLRRA